MRHFYKPCLLAATALGLTGCIDNDYDLSDIDTTVRLVVNDLVVPITIDTITLESIISIDEDDEHIKIIDGEYCYYSDGEFSSDAISIPSINVSALEIAPAYFYVSQDVTDGTVSVAGYDLLLDISSPRSTELSLQAENISEDIVSIDHIAGDTRLVVSFDFGSTIQQLADAVTLYGVKMQLPLGCTIGESSYGSYDSATGIYTIADVECSSSGLEIPLDINAIEVGDYFNPEAHTYDFTSEVGVTGDGQLLLKIKDGVTEISLSEEIEVTINISISSFFANKFTGKVKYSISDVNIPEVTLDDLPDVLAQEGTNLIISNPCIYLSVNNPLQSYSLYAQTGMQIQANRETESSRTFKTDENIVIGNPIQSSGTYIFCLSPTKPSGYDSEYSDNCTHVSFTSLSDVLSGYGLPNTLDISLTDPSIPAQQVTDFLLGTDYEGVKGNYKFLAPLQLEAGSTIKYSDTLDGWSREGLDNVTITSLEVSLVVSTNIPVRVDFTGYPLNVHGNRINNVSIEGASIDANADAQEVCIKISGEITELDGIAFEAVATASGGNVLNTDMTVSLSNIRPMVSGYYEKEI